MACNPQYHPSQLIMLFTARFCGWLTKPRRNCCGPEGRTPASIVSNRVTVRIVGYRVNRFFDRSLADFVKLIFAFSSRT